MLWTQLLVFIIYMGSSPAKCRCIMNAWVKVYQLRLASSQHPLNCQELFQRGGYLFLWTVMYLSRQPLKGNADVLLLKDRERPRGIADGLRESCFSRKKKGRGGAKKWGRRVWENLQGEGHEDFNLPSFSFLFFPGFPESSQYGIKQSQHIPHCVYSLNK